MRSALRALLCLFALVACGPRVALDAGVPGDGGDGPDGGVPDEGTPVDGGDGPDGGVDFCAPLPEATCAGTVPKFSDLQPILARRCQGCHDGRPGGAWPLVTYQEVSDWQDAVRGEIVLCTMPPLDGGVVMTFAERDAIFTWVRCGRPQ